MLDLSLLTEPGIKFCVRCWSEKSTLRFLEEMFLQHPDKCKHWRVEDNMWTEGRNNHIDYFPNINEYGGLTWDDSDYAETCGYTIIDYCNIPEKGSIIDLGEIENPETNFSTLF